MVSIYIYNNVVSDSPLLPSIYYKMQMCHAMHFLMNLHQLADYSHLLALRLDKGDNMVVATIVTV